MVLTQGRRCRPLLGRRRPLYPGGGSHRGLQDATAAQPSPPRRPGARPVSPQRTEGAALAAPGTRMPALDSGTAVEMDPTELRRGPRSLPPRRGDPDFSEVCHTCASPPIGTTCRTEPGRTDVPPAGRGSPRCPPSRQAPCQRSPYVQSAAPPSLRVDKGGPGGGACVAGFVSSPVHTTTRQPEKVCGPQERLSLVCLNQAPCRFHPPRPSESWAAGR